MPIHAADEALQDLALAHRAAAGDPAALEAFYDCYADPLYAFIYHHLGEPRIEVEEVWQETLVAAVGSMEAYRGESRLYTWLCSIARHKMADYCRRLGRQLSHLNEAPLEQLEHLMDAGPLPEEELARRDVRLMVVEATASLPQDQRHAFVARYADGCSVAEIARQLGRSYKAVEALLGRARAAFREALANLEGDYDV